MPHNTHTGLEVDLDRIIALLIDVICPKVGKHRISKDCYCVCSVEATPAMPRPSTTIEIGFSNASGEPGVLVTLAFVKVHTYR
jgi:hypothetical protein